MGDVPFDFQAGGVCGGNGQCVNSTLNPGLLLCLCNPGYSGASDFFDNRVEQLPDGTWLSFSCHASQVGTIVVWVFFLLCGLIRAKQLAPLLVQFWKKHYADPVKVKKGLLADFPLGIVAFDLFAVCIPLFITGIGKLCGMTLGTDALVTITLCFTIVSFQVGVLHLTRREFTIFVKGTMNPKEARKAQKLRDWLKLFTITYFVGITIVPSLWTLSLDKSLGPIANNERTAIFFRNIGAAGYGVLDMWTTWMIRKRVKKLISSSNHEDQAVRFIINKMDAEMKTYIVFLGTIGLTYGIFVIPYLFQFQTYSIAVIVGLGALRHSGKVFANDADAKAHGLNSAESLDAVSAMNSKSAVGENNTGSSAVVVGNNKVVAAATSSVAESS